MENSGVSRILPPARQENGADHENGADEDLENEFFRLRLVPQAHQIRVQLLEHGLQSEQDHQSAREVADEDAGEKRAGAQIGPTAGEQHEQSDDAERHDRQAVDQGNRGECG